MHALRKTATALLAALVVTACARVAQDSRDPAATATPAPAQTPARPEAAAAALSANAGAAPEARKAVAPASSRSDLDGLSKRRVEMAAVMEGDAAALSVHPAPAAEQRERYQSLAHNPVQQVAQAPVSTFSLDVDTGSYSNVRRMLVAGQLPPPDAVRVEELVNYFPYQYDPPGDGQPFAVHTELAPSPWNPGNVILRIGVKGQDQAKHTLPPANLVFLVDVSGSMDSPDKLPLLKSSLKLLVKELRARDRITLVTYAGSTAVALPPTPGNQAAAITLAIDTLSAGGSTAGASGIELAYRAAQQAFIPGGINRILLATDGDFNVGVTDFQQLKAMVEEKRKSGVALTTLGFGTGNYNEQLMEQLADAGDGAYSYIDTLMEGHKVLVNEMTSTLATIARDVKVQVEFNPAAVREYRLIGYENRTLQREDFNNDRVDAGDIGAGHTVTALYELTLADGTGLIDDSRYGLNDARPAGRHGDELAHVKLRFKEPGADTSRRLDMAVGKASMKPLALASGELRFALAVAGFGQMLRGGRHTGGWTFSDARALAGSAVGADRFGYRGEFLRLVDLAQSLSTRKVGEAGAVAVPRGR